MSVGEEAIFALNYTPTPVVNHIFNPYTYNLFYGLLRGIIFSYFLYPLHVWWRLREDFSAKNFRERERERERGVAMIDDEIHFHLDYSEYKTTLYASIVFYI